MADISFIFLTMYTDAAYDNEFDNENFMNVF